MYHLFRKWGRVGSSRIGAQKLEKLGKVKVIDEFRRLFTEKTGNHWKAWEAKEELEKQPGKFYLVDIVSSQWPTHLCIWIISSCFYFFDQTLLDISCRGWAQSFLHLCTLPSKEELSPDNLLQFCSRGCSEVSVSVHCCKSSWYCVHHTDS